MTTRSHSQLIKRGSLVSGLTLHTMMLYLPLSQQVCMSSSQWPSWLTNSSHIMAYCAFWTIVNVNMIRVCFVWITVSFSAYNGSPVWKLLDFWFKLSIRLIKLFQLMLLYRESHIWGPAAGWQSSHDIKQFSVMFMPYHYCHHPNLRWLSCVCVCVCVCVFLSKVVMEGGQCSECVNPGNVF